MWHNDYRTLVSCWSCSWRQNKIISDFSDSIRLLHLDSWIGPLIPLREEDELLPKAMIHLHKHWHLVPFETAWAFKTSLKGLQMWQSDMQEIWSLLEQKSKAEDGGTQSTIVFLHKRILHWMPTSLHYEESPGIKLQWEPLHLLRWISPVISPASYVVSSACHPMKHCWSHTFPFHTTMES